MSKEDKVRRTINQLAQQYRNQVNPSITHEQARRRVIDGMNKNNKR